MREVGVDSERDERSEDSSGSDDPEPQEKEPNDYEKQRDLRVSQNKAKMEALGLQGIANSLVDLGQKKGKVITQLRRSKRVSKNSKDDDDYEPNNDDDGDGLNGSSEEVDDDDTGKKKKSNKKKKKKVGNECETMVAKNRISRYTTRKYLQKNADTADLMDEDEALKQAVALSLKDSGETSDQQHGRSNEHSHDKKKSFKSRVQMTEDDLVINFCQIDEVGKGNITLRDLQRMAASHDFTWTDKELADMIRCFDSDGDGKLTLDDIRSIVLRCNMLQIPENP